MLRFIAFIAALVLVGSLFFGGRDEMPAGPAVTATLAGLASDPVRYEGRLVRVAGTIGERVSLAGYGGVTLVDGAGNQLVVLGLPTPPAPGETLTVTGEYLTAFTLGDYAAPILLAAPE